jgi:hypothetical protein
MAPPKTIEMAPMRIQLRRPRGIPIITTISDITAAASVYDDAIIGIISVPVGFWEGSIYNQDALRLLDIFLTPRASK